MANIVKYDNDLNTIQFKKFNDNELDLFFSICYKMKEIGEDKIILNFSELKKLSNYSSTSILRFEKDLNNTYKKLLSLNFKVIQSEGEYTLFNLFSDYTVNMKEKKITIALNTKYSYILNELGSTYTKFELEQFVNLKSIYSKNLFKLLKQWESLKVKEFKIEEFRDFLNIPESYNSSKINEKVLKPIFIELPKYFYDLKLEKIKNGRKIVKLKFSWSSSKKSKEIKDLEILISLDLEKVIEKAKKNRFLIAILTKINLKKLIDEFEEKVLINAFNKAYIEIKKEINYSYLRKYIQNTLNIREIKFVVNKDISLIEEPIEKEKELTKEILASKEKKKISQKEKEKKYKEYLEKYNLEDNKFNKRSFEINFDKEFVVIEKSVGTKILYDELGRAYSENFGSFENMEAYKKEFEKDNPELMTKHEENNKIIKEREIERNRYVKKLKAIELELIMANSKELEEFQRNYMQFFRLHDYIYSEMDLEMIPTEKINEVEKRLKELQDYFYQFEKHKEKVLNYEDIEQEKLLSKKGRPLFGGALVSRLNKIAKNLKVKIKYKDKIIDC